MTSIPTQCHDLSGNKYGLLTAIQFYRVSNGAAFWECRCDCGETKIIRAAFLRNGKTKSCGCLVRVARRRTKKRSVDLTGKRFGMLLVKEKAEESGKWNCVCDCGKRTAVKGSNLNNGNTASCGCQRGCQRHGMSYIPEYNVYMAMKQRCLNANHRYFSFYGGRGITICDRWLGDDGFNNFIADMGRRPSKRHSIDRIDNSRGYSPDNCRWATRKQQQSNMRKNKRITHKGETLTVSQWARRIGMSRTKLGWRLNHGWSIDRAMNTP